jgi:hypothetical protein
MKKPEVNVLKPELRLSLDQRQLLLATVSQEGFAVLQQVMEDEVNRLNLKLINTDAADRDAVCAAHAMAKAAGQFYEGFIQRLNEEFDLHLRLASKIGTIENPEVLPLLEEFQGNEEEL